LGAVGITNIWSLLSFIFLIKKRLPSRVYHVLPWPNR
jgi:hypothetical protein